MYPLKRNVRPVKIQTKLTLRFTLVVALILAVLLSAIYFFAYSYKQNKFYERVKERALISAHIFLEKDEVSKSIFESFQQQYVQKLHEEIVQIYDEKNRHQFVKEDKEAVYSEELIDKIRNEKEVRFKDGDRLYYGIYYKDNQGNFVITASAVDKFGDSNLDNLRLIMIGSFILGLFITYVSGNLYAKKALQPISQIIDEVKDISASNLNLRVKERNERDEIAELAVTFNRMLSRIEAAFNMQKTFVSNASHEMRTPLTAITGQIEVLLSKPRTEQEYEETLRGVLLEVNELSDLINNLLGLTQTNLDEKGLELSAIRLDELILDLRAHIDQQSLNKELIINFESLPEEEKDLLVMGNKSLLNSALLNIVENGFKFSDNKAVTLNFSAKDGKKRIEIKDKGIGISHEDQKQIFEPFFRADTARQFSGHGIGLPLSEKIIRMHGGRIYIDSELDKGTNVIVEFE